MTSHLNFHRPLRSAVAAITLVGLAGCAVPMPTEPRVVAMPGAGKTYDQFNAEDAACRQAAYIQAGPGPSAEQSNGAVVGSALLERFVTSYSNIITSYCTPFRIRSHESSMASPSRSLLLLASTF